MLAERYKTGTIAAFLTVLIGLINVTPLCGLLFQCHCDWPWLDFYFDCNYFDAEASHKCPWCVSDLAGFGSIGLAFILAMLAAVFLKTRNFAAKAITVRLTFGLAIFILISVLSGALAAFSQHYPMGVGASFTTIGGDNYLP